MSKESKEFNKSFKEFKKVINKKDDISYDESIKQFKILYTLDKTELFDRVKNELNKMLTGKSFLEAIVSKLNFAKFKIEPTFVTYILDMAFRNGNNETQSAAVLLLSKYDDNTELMQRYRFIFVKNKKAQEKLHKLFANKELKKEDIVVTEFPTEKVEVMEPPVTPDQVE